MSHQPRVTVAASPNIALIKYWGKTNHDFNLPMNASLSLPLGDLTCTVNIWPGEKDDWLGDLSLYAPQTKEKILRFIAVARDLYPDIPPICGTSLANFPAGCGLSSSAAFYAALAGAMLGLIGVRDPVAISRLARIGSGSATRSVIGGHWVGWLPGAEEQSYGYVLDGCTLPSRWVDRILIYEMAHKRVPSRVGHTGMDHSPLTEGRVFRANTRFIQCTREIRAKNWANLCDWVMEETHDFVSLLDQTGHAYLTPRARDAINRLFDIYRMDRKMRPWFVTVDAGSSLHVVGDASVVENVISVLDADPLIVLSSLIGGGGIRWDHVDPLENTSDTVSETDDAPSPDAVATQSAPTA